MAANDKWREIKGPCPICGKSGHWCTVAVNGSVVKCRRVESPYPVKQRDGIAWLHRTTPATAPKAAAAKSGDYLTSKQLNTMLAEYSRAMTTSRMGRISRSLGITERSLEIYGVGYAVPFSTSLTGCYSFPMYDGKRQVIGIHLRPEGGRKKICVRGSRQGLFIPSNYDAAPLPDGLCSDNCPLLLATPEGVSNCCAAFDMGFRAIGRPNNSGGGDYLCELLGAGPKQQVIVFADRDETKFTKTGEAFFPGIEGAVHVCEQIQKVCNCQFGIPREGAKDWREWFAKDGLATVITEVLATAVPVTPRWLASARKRIEQKRENERKVVAA